MALRRLLVLIAVMCAAAGCGSGGSRDGGGAQSSSSSSASSIALSTTFCIPYRATATDTGGRDGVLVIPSDNLAPSPVFVSSVASTRLTYTVQAQADRSGITGYTPYSITYAAGRHLYRLKLADTSAAPTPAQLGNLEISPTQICGSGAVQGNLSDPTTLLIVLNIAGSGGCGAGGDTYRLMRCMDSASTSPQALTIGSADIHAVYAADGTLGGVVALDPASGRLQFHPGTSFSSPVTLAGGVTAISRVYSIYISMRGSPDTYSVASRRLADGALFLAVTTATGGSLHPSTPRDTPTVSVPSRAPCRLRPAMTATSISQTSMPAPSGSSSSRWPADRRSPSTARLPRAAGPTTASCRRAPTAASSSSMCSMRTFFRPCPSAGSQRPPRRSE